MSLYKTEYSQSSLSEYCSVEAQLMCLSVVRAYREQNENTLILTEVTLNSRLGQLLLLLET